LTFGFRFSVFSFQFSVFSFQIAPQRLRVTTRHCCALPTSQQVGGCGGHLQTQQSTFQNLGSPVAYQSFEELAVWRRACRLAVQVYDTSRVIHDRMLRDQMRRAAISIPSNIAEGAERGGRDFIRFLRIARGSAAELRTQCYIASQVGALPPDQAAGLVAQLKEMSKMLTALARSIDPGSRRKT
jgi:four helix bundle protein